MPCTDCNDTNVPEVDNSSIECCELVSDKCVVTSEAVPCLQVGKGATLAHLLKRLCNYLKSFSFLSLKDTPSSYVDQGGKCVKVNTMEDGLDFYDCSSENTVLYTETELIAGNTLAIDPSYSVLPNTSYTVPTGGAGDYEVLYTGNFNTSLAGFGIIMEVRVNGTIVRSSAKTDLFGGKTKTSFSLFVSEITLSEGDTITVEASVPTEPTALENLNYKIKKLT